MSNRTVTPLPEDTLPPEQGEDRFDALDDDEKERAEEWWMGHQRCEGCLDVFVIGDGDYTEGQGKFYCADCLPTVMAR